MYRLQGSLDRRERRKLEVPDRRCCQLAWRSSTEFPPTWFWPATAA